MGWNTPPPTINTSQVTPHWEVRSRWAGCCIWSICWVTWGYQGPCYTASNKEGGKTPRVSSIIKSFCVEVKGRLRCLTETVELVEDHSQSDRISFNPSTFKIQEHVFGCKLTWRSRLTVKRQPGVQCLAQGHCVTWTGGAESLLPSLCFKSFQNETSELQTPSVLAPLSLLSSSLLLYPPLTQIFSLFRLSALFLFSLSLLHHSCCLLLSSRICFLFSLSAPPTHLM